ncbi:MAG: phosphotyrosine protein phosphatase [Synoicihabitans sp.]
MVAEEKERFVNPLRRVVDEFMSARDRGEIRPINLLFVCSKNQWRSPTGERIYRDHPLVNARSAGTASSARHQISLADIEWADLIAVMERKHRQRLRADYPEALRGKEVIVLEIEDNYRAMDPDLVELIKASIDPLLAEI